MMSSCATEHTGPAISPIVVGVSVADESVVVERTDTAAIEGLGLGIAYIGQIANSDIVRITSMCDQFG